jgi:hypothetical protein
MLGVALFYCYAEFHIIFRYAECRYAEGHDAECCGAANITFVTFP